MNAVAGALGGGDDQNQNQNQQQQQQQDQNQQQQQQQQDQNQQQQNQPPAWMGNLSDASLREGDVAGRLSRYGSVDDVAKALIETQDFARGRVALPKPGDENSYNEFIAKVRPESADAYKFDVPDGDSGATAEAFRPVAHRIGLTEQQGAEIAKWFNQHQGETLGKLASDGKQQLSAFELELGPEAFNTRLEAAGNMLANLPGFEDAEKRAKALSGLEQTLAPRETMELLFTLAEATGELEKVDGDAVTLRLGGMSAAQAQAKIDEKSKDRAFMSLASQKGTKEAEQWNSWNRIAASD